MCRIGRGWSLLFILHVRHFWESTCGARNKSKLLKPDTGDDEGWGEQGWQGRVGERAMGRAPALLIRVRAVLLFPQSIT
jgi:hypothetical protein